MNKRQKAFTLAELFLAMVILSILVSVCLTFFTQRHDYEREYFYYTAYRNLVNVVDSALFNDAYLKGTNARIEETTCGTSGNSRKCRVFKTVTTDANGLCGIFLDYFNTAKIYNDSGTEVAACTVQTNNPVATNPPLPSLKLTNGMDIYFKELTVDPSTTITDLVPASGASVAVPEMSGYEIWVDINGQGQGEDKMNYDVFKFYITRDGKVIPVYGTVDPGIRGYEYLPADMDGGGNIDLAAFDVIYSPRDNDSATLENHTLVLGDDYRSVPFPLAACASGYVNDATPYCTGFKYYNNATTPALITGVSKAAMCTNDYADCKVRLVKKLKRIK